MTEVQPAVQARFQLTQATVSLGGRPVLQDVSLNVEAGQTVAIVGPSGAGKTTLLRLLTGAVRLQTGTVEVSGRDLSQLPSETLRRLRSQIGFIHQDLRLVPNLRVSQNVLCGALGRQSLLGSLRMILKPGQDDLNHVHQLLERVGIAEKMFQRVDRLSGGQTQRVAVARALFQRPNLLLADEPVASVDPARAADTLGLLTDICHQDGLTLCVSLHAPQLVRRYFQRVVGLRQGRLVFDLPVDQVTDTQLEDLYRLESDHGV